MMSTVEENTQSQPSPSNPWYSDSAVGRDRSHVLEKRETDWKAVSEDPTARFVLQTSKGIYHRELAAKDGASGGGMIPSPIFYTFEELVALFGGEETIQKSMQAANAKQLLAWLGEHDNHNYWVCYNAGFEDSITETTTNNLRIAGLREFGDRMESSVEAAILATSNGLVEFHKAHPFCSKCGSPTRVSKAGASRKCTNSDCNASVYPRMDVASIMLITSPCEQYALLGRKANWPKGRYSTLAGFAEVGETLEQCCIRETLEESGVYVDPCTTRFVCSQPWPFPRSLMVGFRGKAKQTTTNDTDGLPPIEIDPNEMEDIQWFAKDYVKKRLEGGSTAMGFQPSESEQEFHIPGPSSLARILIRQWANEE